MMIRGSWTSARAIAVRCCSPPDSLVAACFTCPVSPTSAMTRSTAGRIWRRGVPVTSSANATPAHGLARQRLEVLEHDPDLAPDLRHLAAADPGEVEAVDDHVAARREPRRG